jgi:Zn-dependent protease with chaperone function
LAAEYTCDRAALLVAQDPDEIITSSIVKLFAGKSKYAIGAEAFMAQCVEYDELLKSANPLVHVSIRNQQRTHPLPVQRVAELQKWAESNDYKIIMKSGKEMVTL